MNLLGKCIVAAALCGASAPAMAQQFPGKLIAAFYMEEMSHPKGWTLSYKGREGPHEVFIMDRDLDAHPQTSFLRPVDQMRRLMCGDETLKAMMNRGVSIRVDSRDLKGGKTRLARGPHFNAC